MVEKQKKINIAFNGFGRIGRNLVRKLISDTRYNIVAINARSTVDVRAHLFKYDSVHGRYKGDISYELDNLIIDGHVIPNFDRRTPSKLPWGELEVDFVIDSTGKFTNKHDLEQHIEAGAKNVIVTSPAKDVDATLVFGVNENDYKVKDHNIISASSCTTTCLTPILKILQKNYGIKHGTMTTVHSYTMGQSLLDNANGGDLRRARAASTSIIPTSTGAAQNVGIVIPELEGKLDGLAIRVPVPNVSLLDLTLELETDTTMDQVIELFEKEKKLHGILCISYEPLVSIDYIGNSCSAIVDTLASKMVNKRLLQLIAFYDNEYGYCCRVLDLMAFMAKKLSKPSTPSK